MTAVAGVILIKERHIVEAFERIGATSPDQARLLSDIPTDESGIAMRRLKSRAVVREAGPGYYYADLEVWQALRRMRRRVAVGVIVIAAGIAAWSAFGLGYAAMAAR